MIPKSYATLPPIPNSVPEYLDTTEVAELLRIKNKVVWQHIKSGLRASKIGKRWLVNRADLDSYIASRQKVGA